MKSKIIHRILASKKLPQKEIHIQQVHDWLAFQGLFRIACEPSTSRHAFLEGEIPRHFFAWIDCTACAVATPQSDLIPARTAVKRALREFDIRGKKPADTADSICSLIGAWDFICLPPQIQYEIAKRLKVHPLSIGGVQ